MSLYMTSDHETAVFSCPIKRETDERGGVKVQVYGLNSYDYLQYSNVKKDLTLFPKELEGCLTVDEWDVFWNSQVRNVLWKHQIFDCLVATWIVVGLFVFTTLFTGLHKFPLLVLVATFFVGLVCFAASWPKNCKEELRDVCRTWSKTRREAVSTNEAGNLQRERLLEVRFFHESGPPTRHGRNHLGVVHFLPVPFSRHERERREKQIQKWEDSDVSTTTGSDAV